MTHTKRRRQPYSRHKIGTSMQYEFKCEMRGSDVNYNEVFRKMVTCVNENNIPFVGYSEHMDFVNCFLTRVSQNTTFRWMSRR